MIAFVARAVCVAIGAFLLRGIESARAKTQVTILKSGEVVVQVSTKFYAIVRR